MDRFDPFVKYADVYGDIINWEKDPMNKPQNQNKYFFSDGKTYYEQICKMLRLMSVFKEAFNQIYNNEDEISEAWENFVNNLSASVVEGSEPDVTLTWTDDSVNFEFTMVPGVPGEQGVGITSISFNSDYTMTITLSDGNTYTSMSLKGETGPQGPQGETGSGLQILDVYATLADLQSAHPTGQPGDAYQVGSAGNYTLYIWSSSQSAWVPAGSLGTVSPSLSNPLMDGTASAGSQNLYSRGDHVHPTDTSRASKEELDALIKTSQSLIDQSFTYRESPAIQDGLARIDKIKGNTLVWNQLIQKGNMTDGWTFTNSSGGYSNNILTFTASAQAGFVRPNLPQQIISGHKYLGTVDVKGTSAFLSNILFTGNTEGGLPNVNITTEWQTFAKVFTNTVTGANYYPRVSDLRTSGWDAVQIRNCMLIDLTQMFGAGNEPTIEQFTNLFNADYYSFDAGSLLNLTATGLKSQNANASMDSTLDLTIATYFPTGMKSAGSAYDELTNNKATTRVKQIIFDGSSDENWLVVSSTNRAYIAVSDIDTSTPNTSIGNIMSNMYVAGDYNTGAIADKITTRYEVAQINVFDSANITSSSTASTWKAYLQEHPLIVNYGLATPTETSVDLDLDFMAYEDGTEQLLPVNGSVPETSPIIADMTYLSIDDAMEYIIEKLANVPENTQQILESLEDDVADLQTDVGALQPAVSGLQTSVGNINTNIGQISSTVAGHTASISDMQSDISDLDTGLSNLDDTVTANTARIGTLETGLSNTNGQVQNLATSVSGLDSTVTAQGETVTALDNFVSNIANTRNPGYMSPDNSIGITSAFLNMTLAAGQSTWANIPLPTIMAGFIPLFVVGASTGDGSVCLVKIPSTYNQNNIYKVGVKNTSNSEVTTQVGIEILCIKQRQSQ